MTSPQQPPLYDAWLDALITRVGPEHIIAFKASPEVQAYAQVLLERRSDGTISADEEQTLQQMLQFERLLSLLKAKALYALQP